MNQIRPARSWTTATDKIPRLGSLQGLDALSADWAWGGSNGAGVRVAVIDSGIDNDHPAIDGHVKGWVSFSEDAEGMIQCEEAPHSDAFGHGTACADIIRRQAPACDLYSLKVLGPRLTGKGSAFLAALRWAIDQGFDAVNLSLGSTKREYFAPFHELVDAAHFKKVALVTAANNMPALSFPSLYAAVISVACHEGTDPLEFYCNPEPPVEFWAPGINLQVAWLGGQQLTVTGNSFSAPHITGLVARILEKHPGLTPFEVKTVLRETARNVAAR